MDLLQSILVNIPDAGSRQILENNERWLVARLGTYTVVLYRTTTE